KGEGDRPRSGWWRGVTLSRGGHPSVTRLRRAPPPLAGEDPSRPHSPCPCDSSTSGAGRAAMATQAETRPAGSGPYRPLALARWLLAVVALVVLRVVVGGITRLTESGLSITEWKPVTGAIPPLSHAQWQAEFEAYQRIGEYRQINGPAGMTLADYKFIYFWEWFHRLLGRLIGLAFALPLAWFWLRGAIPAGYKPRLLALLALGALQGVFGWYMVRSGLNAEVTDVSHFWLSVHLLT